MRPFLRSLTRTAPRSPKIQQRNLILRAKVPEHVTNYLESKQELHYSFFKRKLISLFVKGETIAQEAEKFEKRLAEEAATGCHESKSFLDAIYNLRKIDNTALILQGTPTIATLAEHLVKLVVSIYDKNLDTKSYTSIDVITEPNQPRKLHIHTDYSHHNTPLLEKPIITSLSALESDGAISTGVPKTPYALYDSLSKEDKEILSQNIYSYCDAVYDDEKRIFTPILYYNKNKPTFIIDYSRKDNIIIDYPNSKFSKTEINSAIKNLYNALDVIFQDEVENIHLKSGETAFIDSESHNSTGTSTELRHLLVNVFRLVRNPSAQQLSQREDKQNSL